VPVQRAPGKYAQLPEHVAAARQDSREVHDLREAEHPRVIGERDEVCRGEFRAGGLHRGRRHARRGHHEHRQIQALARVEHVADPSGAQDVRDLVGVAHDGRDTVRQDRIGKAMRRQHRDLDVNVGVDQPGAHVPAVEVDDLPRRPLAEPDDAISAQRDRGVHDLVREHVDHTAAAQKQVGFDGAAGSPDELPEIVHRTTE
jgi:hypothetical protein